MIRRLYSQERALDRMLQTEHSKDQVQRRRGNGGEGKHVSLLGKAAGDESPVWSTHLMIRMCANTSQGSWARANRICLRAFATYTVRTWWRFL